MRLPVSQMLTVLLMAASVASTPVVAAAPVVFWAPDQIAPGDVTLLYGGGLSNAEAVVVRALDSNEKEISAPAIQPCDNSVKFVMPASLKPGVFSVQVVAGGERSAARMINQPELWFVQPTKLRPGLDVNEAPPGADIQIVGKNFSVRGDTSPKPEIVLSRQGTVTRLAVTKAEPFSIIAKIPEGVAAGDYEVLVSNGHGGDAARGTLKVKIRMPDVWPEKVFNVRDFGAKGDDVTDDTTAIRSALAAADTNGGGVVYFPWGTYRLTNWICIPPRTLVHGESRDSTILKWPVDEPTSPTNFTTAAIFGAAPYALEDLTIIVRKTDTALMDMSWEHFYQRNVPPELLPKMKPWGAFRDVFIRRVFFQHWLLCSHPEREPDLAKKFWEGAYNIRVSGVKNFEVSDCTLWGANNYFANNQNARITGNSIANGMGGHSWTCLGGGAHFVVCESNDLNCSSSWGWGWIGMQKIYSAHNISHNFVRGEREAMTCDISALPTARPVSQYWGTPIEVGNSADKPFLKFPPPGQTNLDGFATGFTPGCFKDGTVTIRAYNGGENANQSRQIVDNNADTIFLDKTFSKPPDTTPRKLYVEVMPRHAHAHGGTTAWVGRPAAISETSVTTADANWIPQEFVGMTVLVLDGKGAGQYRTVIANSKNETTLDRAWDVAPDTNSVIGVWSLMRHMIVYDCEGYDTSAFAQLYGAFFDYVVDGCRVERTQGIWGQMGWFVQFRNNTVSFANTYHPGIGARGPNPEHCAPFGYTGLDGSNLRITKGQAFQYPGRKIPLFVNDVIGSPVPATIGHIQRGNTLRYNQRLVVQPWSDANPPGPRPGGALFRDIVIDGNRIEHSPVGIQLGPNVGGAVIGKNEFLDVAKPVLEAKPGSAALIPGNSQ